MTLYWASIAACALAIIQCFRAAVRRDRRDREQGRR